MAGANIFGPIVTGRTVRVAMINHLKMWFPTYLAEVARIEDLNPATMPVFRSWVSALDMPDGKYEEHQMPCCVVVAPGLLGEPERRGGTTIATWGVSVGAVVSGQDRDNTLGLAEIYAAAIRAAVVQHPGLGGFATATDWLGERYDDIPNEMLRTLAAGSVQFAVQVYSAVASTGGPDEPFPDPIPDPGPGATFTSVEVELQKETLT